MKKYYLNNRETESFYELLEIKKDLITKALYKVKIHICIDTVVRVVKKYLRRTGT